MIIIITMHTQVAMCVSVCACVCVLVGGCVSESENIPFSEWSKLMKCGQGKMIWPFFSRMGDGWWGYGTMT